jgi:hypothetical protein
MPEDEAWESGGHARERPAAWDARADLLLDARPADVEVFSEIRRMGGAAALAVQTGAALVPVILWFEGDDWGAHIHEEIPVPAGGGGEQKAAAMMQEVAVRFEAGIRAHPQDWHMLQRVFVADLDRARLRPAAGS